MYVLCIRMDVDNRTILALTAIIYLIHCMSLESLQLVRRFFLFILSTFMYLFIYLCTYSSTVLIY